jgi:hypothetical protein
MKHDGNRGDKEPAPVLWVEREGVRMYGEPGGKVEQKDLETLRVSTGSLLHVTRHLTGMSPEARQRLVGKSHVDGGQERVIDDEFIDAQLASTGSKFNEKITDPQLMIDFCLRRYKEAIEAGDAGEWLKRSETGMVDTGIFIDVTPEQKVELGLGPEDHLGTSSVIEITPEVADKVRREIRGKGEVHDHIEVNVVGGTPPVTDQMVIVLRRHLDSDVPEFFSAYSGILTPNMPRPDRQAGEELAHNKAWWDSHAFVK